MDNEKIKRFRKIYILRRKIRTIYETLETGINSIDTVLYFTTFIFLKYINDISKENEKSFIIPEDCDFDFIYASRSKKNIDKILNEVLIKIENENLDKLKGLSEIDFTSDKFGKQNLRRVKIAYLIEELNTPFFNFKPNNSENKYSPSEIINQILLLYYSSYRHNTTISSSLNNFSEISSLLLEPKKEENVLNPISGFGIVLKTFIKHNTEKLNYSFFERRSYLKSITKMYLLTNNIFNINNLNKDDIEKAEIQFNIMIMACINTERPIISNRLFDRSYDIIFNNIDKILTSDGRAAILIPYSLLLNNYFSDNYINDYGRNNYIQLLIDKNLLDAVINYKFIAIGLRRSKTAILILKNNRKRKNILFIDPYLKSEIELQRKLSLSLNKNKLLDTYQHYKTEENYSYLATYEEIKENDFNLDISLYLKEKKEITQTETQTELKKEIKELEEKLEKVKDELKSEVE